MLDPSVAKVTSWSSRAIRIGLSAAVALSSFGCAARYSTENLHSIAPNAGIAEVCARFPMGDPDATVVAYNSKTRIAVSDGNWSKFTKFAAEEADFIYRYDPLLPNETTELFPDPYKKISCRANPSSSEARLPVGLEPIRMTPTMRDALVGVLIEERLRVPIVEGEESASIEGKRFLGQVTPAGLGPRAVYSPEAVDEVGRMLRDAIRNGVPRVQNGSNEAISILDTSKMQVVGGLAAGATIGVVPGGWLVSTALQASPNVPKPTREFTVGQSIGEMGSGALQMFIGGGGTIGGFGLSGTGGGAIVGVPVCAAGVALMANGAATFLHGATTLVITICKWDDLPKVADAQPLAAVAPKDAAPSAPPPASPGPAPAPVKPAPAPAPAPVKPAPTPVAAPVKPVVAAPVNAAPVKVAPPLAKPTDPTVVTIGPSGSTTTTRPKLKPGEKPSDTTLTIHKDEAGRVQSMEVTTTVKAAPAELKPYGGPGGGHHPVAKRAMEGAPHYDANQALAIPKAELERLTVKHEKITGAQMRRYKEFAKQGMPLTWDKVAEIETASLVDALMDPKTAQATVAKAIQALKDSSVAGPIRIPWGK